MLLESLLTEQTAALLSGSVCDDECHGFARVVKFDGDAVMGFGLLKELTGDEGEKVSEELALTEDDWCDDPRRMMRSRER